MFVLPGALEAEDDMGGRNNKLEDDVLEAFERACCEENWLVAEHLLRALEAMEERDGLKGQIEQAFLRFAEQVRQFRRPH